MWGSFGSSRAVSGVFARGLLSKHSLTHSDVLHSFLSRFPTSSGEFSSSIHFKRERSCSDVLCSFLGSSHASSSPLYGPGAYVSALVGPTLQLANHSLSPESSSMLGGSMDDGGGSEGVAGTLTLSVEVAPIPQGIPMQIPSISADDIDSNMRKKARTW
jgi:hypothetical protein